MKKILDISLVTALTLTIITTPSFFPYAADSHSAAGRIVAKSQPNTISSADRAWQTLKHDYETPPKPLMQLPNRMYTHKEIQDYYCSIGDRAGAVADEAKRFYTKYPKHPQAVKAQEIYFDMLHTSVLSGSKRKIAELEAATAERLKNPKLDSDARFKLSLRLLKSAVSGRQYESNDAMRLELEKRARHLAKEYPNRPDGDNYLMSLARNAPSQKAVTLAREVLAQCRDEKLKTECKGIITRTAALDKPFTLTLSTTGGQTIKTNQMKGKPILLLFWDSQSRFSSKAIYVVNEMYKTYHEKGVEFIGLNFDSDLAKAATPIKDYDLKWPQYFDKNTGWSLRNRYGLETLPACWFIDKKGFLRELHGERDPYGMADKLLAE